MPRYKKTVVTTVTSEPVDLTTSFTATTSGGVNYSYTQSSNLRLFLRFNAAITNLATFTSNDEITLAYNAPGSLELLTETLGSRNISGFLAKQQSGKNIHCCL